ncbi:energy-coupling factor transport system ATP-binding protein [Saliterribacillus persicus]|uniref:Energy-coupling factor transport system ATP-binding protein n=2 Tax=Saliterribacillus persicus TaxID=930114 RepID=A0A368X6H4_9BACI|nr:energy-coupling factor transport system ATP-binding protein [Saliterribacillus persicus]
MKYMNNYAVEFNNVSFRYHEDEPWILKDVSFKIEANKTTAIIGHNGSGKSTIAKLMNGLLLPEHGQIYIYGTRVEEESIWDIRREVGMVFQNPDNQFVGTTVKDDVAFGLENRGIPRLDMQKRIDETLKAVGMIDYLLHEPYRLSGGQKQRVAIASVMAITPSILILDEATSMLDPLGRKEILETVQHLRKKDNLSLIMISHEVNEMIKADYVIVMEDGKVSIEGTPKTIFSSEDRVKEVGLDIPLVTEFALSLKRHGMELESNPLTHEELLETLWTYHLKT